MIHTDGQSNEHNGHSWSAVLQERFRSRSIPVVIGESYTIPASTIYSGLMLWAAHFRHNRVGRNHPVIFRSKTISVLYPLFAALHENHRVVLDQHEVYPDELLIQSNPPQAGTDRLESGVFLAKDFEREHSQTARLEVIESDSSRISYSDQGLFELIDRGDRSEHRSIIVNGGNILEKQLLLHELLPSLFHSDLIQLEFMPAKYDGTLSSHRGSVDIEKKRAT